MDLKRDGAQIDAYGRAHIAEELRADGRRDGLHLDGYGAAKYCHFLLVLCIGVPLLAPPSREDLERDKLQKWADI